MKVERTGDTYVARDDTGAIVWRIELALDMSGTPFREELVWPAASVVAIAGGPSVHFVAAASGAIVKTLSLAGDLFGHFGPVDDVLYILGWRNVVAVDSTLEVRWVSHDLAIDGIVWKSSNDERIELAAEIDPPGGWVDVDLDVATGKILRGRTFSSYWSK